MKPTLRLLTGALLLPAALAACAALPTAGPAAPQPSQAVALGSPAALATVTPILSSDTPGALVTLVFTQAAPPPASALDAADCNRVAPGQPMDVTVSDGSGFQPGESFSKTWRLVNAGSCGWDEAYSVVLFSGQRFGPVVEQRLSDQVAPGSALEVTVEMVAPGSPGVYQSNWMMRSAEGVLFGLGPDGNAPFWVKIEVLPRSTDTPSPQATSAEALPVFTSATASLLLNQSLDLDSGDVEPEAGADMAYGFDLRGQLALVPQNGARAGLFDMQLPSEAECQGAFLSSDAVTLVLPLEGQYLCYRTNQGLPGYLRLADEQTEGALALDFVTWLVP